MRLLLVILPVHLRLCNNSGMSVLRRSPLQ
jgi:hypothetical protein